MERWGWIFFSFVCGGDQRWGGVIIFQVWVGVTIRVLIWSQLFQLMKNFLHVSLFGRVGGYFWGHTNVINGRVGFRNSGLGIGWELLLREIILPLGWMRLSVGRWVDLGVY